ncbi:hypothetical protein GALMADRAFT_1362020 [Galerina marginata CBS 339.88]|uniref:Uncharacterized protein n=1 Tax=Galerina marginata (strain CBS 339.88) TaxID=685588 RepID=A0A067TDU6_GALM3|nr:hypothetical protein GALMADRAFT_1362020 [Galerina marginata CBS 339.88]
MPPKRKANNEPSPNEKGTKRLKETPNSPVSSRLRAPKQPPMQTRTRSRRLANPPPTVVNSTEVVSSVAEPSVTSEGSRRVTRSGGLRGEVVSPAPSPPLNPLKKSFRKFMAEADAMRKAGADEDTVIRNMTARVEAKEARVKALEVIKEKEARAQALVLIKEKYRRVAEGKATTALIIQQARARAAVAPSDEEPVSDSYDPSAVDNRAAAKKEAAKIIRRASAKAGFPPSNEEPLSDSEDAIDEDAASRRRLDQFAEHLKAEKEIWDSAEEVKAAWRTKKVKEAGGGREFFAGVVITRPHRSSMDMQVDDGHDNGKEADDEDEDEEEEEEEEEEDPNDMVDRVDKGKGRERDDGDDDSHDPHPDRSIDKDGSDYDENEGWGNPAGGNTEGDYGGGSDEQHSEDDMEVDDPAAYSNGDDDCDDEDVTPRGARRLYRRSNTSADEAFFAKSALNSFNVKLVQGLGGQSPIESGTSGSDFSETRRLRKTQRAFSRQVPDHSETEDEDDAALAADVVLSSPVEPARQRGHRKIASESEEDPEAEFRPSQVTSTRRPKSAVDDAAEDVGVGSAQEEEGHGLSDFEMEDDFDGGIGDEEGDSQPKNKGGRHSKEWLEDCKRLGEAVRIGTATISKKHKATLDAHLYKLAERWNLFQQFLSLQNPDIGGLDEFRQLAKEKWGLFLRLSKEEQIETMEKITEALTRLTRDESALKSAVRRLASSKREVQKNIEFISRWNPDIHYLVLDFYTGNDPAARQNCGVIASSALGEKIMKENPAPISIILDGVADKFRSSEADNKFETYMKEHKKRKEAFMGQANSQAKEAPPTTVKPSSSAFRAEVTEFVKQRLLVLAPGEVANNVKWAKLSAIAKKYGFCLDGWPSAVVSSLPHEELKAIPLDSQDYQEIPLITDTYGKALIKIKHLPPADVASIKKAKRLSTTEVHSTISAPPAPVPPSPSVPSAGHWSSPIRPQSNHLDHHQSLGSPLRITTKLTTAYFPSPSAHPQPSFQDPKLSNDYAKALADLNARFEHQAKTKHTSESFTGYRIVNNRDQGTDQLFSFTTPEIQVQESAPAPASKLAGFPFRSDTGGRDSRRKFVQLKGLPSAISPSGLLNQLNGPPSSRSLQSKIPPNHVSKRVYLDGPQFPNPSSASASSSRRVTWGPTTTHKIGGEQRQGSHNERIRYDRERNYQEVVGKPGPSREVFRE